MSNGEMCAHARISLRHIGHADGTLSNSWVCLDCGDLFLPKKWRDYELEQTRAVLADALAERLPLWLAGLVNEKTAVSESLRGYNETGGCECGHDWHWQRCQLGRLLRIVVDGETQRQVDAAHEEALLPQMRGLDYWISSLPAERDFPCNCWSALPWSDDLAMYTHNCNRARAIRGSPRAE